MDHSMDTSYVPRGEDKEGTELLLSPLVTVQFPGSEEWVFCSLAALLANKRQINHEIIIQRLYFTPLLKT